MTPRLAAAPSAFKCGAGGGGVRQSLSSGRERDPLLLTTMLNVEKRRINPEPARIILADIEPF